MNLRIDFKAAKNFTGGFLRVFGRRFSKIIGKDNYKKK